MGLGAQIGLALLYSRHHGFEADQVGLDLMAKAGFDPRENLTFWENMNQSGGQPPEFLSTHPSDENRIKDLKSRMTDALKLYEQAEKADCGNVRLTLGEWSFWTYEDGSRYKDPVHVWKFLDRNLGDPEDDCQHSIGSRIGKINK